MVLDWVSSFPSHHARREYFVMYGEPAYHLQLIMITPVLLLNHEQ